MVSETIAETVNETPVVIKTEVDLENHTVEESDSEKKDLPEKKCEELEVADNRTAEEAPKDIVSFIICTASLVVDTRECRVTRHIFDQTCRSSVIFRVSEIEPNKYEHNLI